MAPPVHADKLSNLLTLIAIGHQGCTQILVKWIENIYIVNIILKRKVVFKCGELCHAKCGRAKSYTFVYKMWVSK